MPEADIVLLLDGGPALILIRRVLVGGDGCIYGNIDALFIGFLFGVTKSSSMNSSSYGLSYRGEADFVRT